MLLRACEMFRWSSLLLLVVACGESSDSPAIQRVEVAQFPSIESRQLDLIFLIDNSNNTSDWQNQLAADMPAFVAQLADGGQFPDLHIGIVTPDLGTTGSLAPGMPAPPVGAVGNGGCADDGDGGVFRKLLVDVDDGNGGRTRNFDGALVPALSTALRLGSTGCGFEQHLHAIRRSLAVNGGDFLRPDASTAVIALVDEDDCSVRDPRFFGPSSAQLGELTSFRCARFGLACDQPLDEDGAKTNCRPDTASPYIEDPALTKTALDAVHGPARATLSVIGGPREPIVVHQVSLGGMVSQALANVCGPGTAFPDSFSAGPSPRLAALADTFASRGQLHTICEPGYASALASIAKRIERSLGIACLDDAAATDDCVAYDVTDNLRTELPRCPASTDCFEIAPDTARCGGGMRVTVDRKTTPSATAHVEVACASHQDNC